MVAGLDRKFGVGYVLRISESLLKIVGYANKCRQVIRQESERLCNIAVYFTGFQVRKMNKNLEIEVILQDIDEIFCFVHDQLDRLKLEPSDQYKRINYTYFKMFCCHFESFCILIKENHFSSAILLMRTMLELFVKSFYFEFIEKEKRSSVEEFLIGEKDSPSFFNMVMALEKYEHGSFGNFRDSFKQFTKSELASYEKFSLFSHGKGEVLKGFFENNKISYTTEQISEVLLTAKGLFEQLSLFLFFAQEESYAGRLVLGKIKA